MLLEQPHMITNIWRVFDDATEQEKADGLSWYVAANKFARGLASSSDGDVDAAAGIIAALSPQVSWERNMLMATRVYQEEPVVGQSGINIEKAKRIFLGESPNEVLGGNKVRSFWRCISDPETRDYVTIDRHSVAVALGSREIDRSHQNILRRKGNYERFVAAYHIAGHYAGMTGAQMQAITWLIWRDRFGEFLEDTSKW